MLQAPEPKALIRALSPILQNTIISSSDKDWNVVKATSAGHGDFLQTYLDDLGSRIQWVSCPECKKEWNALSPSGICVGCEDAIQDREKRDIENGAYLKRSLGLWGVQNYSFSTFAVVPDNRVAYDACVGFKPDSQNLYLFGPCGSGKTHLAGALLKDMAAKGHRIKWITPIYLGRGLRGRYPSDEKDFIDSMCYADVLIIDDVGVGRDSYAILQAVYEILENRKARGLNGLVMTSNWNPPELAKKYDDRLASRIGGMCRLIQLAGKDWRLGPAWR